jgi:photosystem II PsbJ protein
MVATVGGLGVIAILGLFIYGAYSGLGSSLWYFFVKKIIKNKIFYYLLLLFNNNFRTCLF